MARGLSADFLAAMRGGLDKGRRAGRIEWDTRARGSTDSYFMVRLQEETLELAIALHKGSGPDIRREAADVANFAMMIADNWA